jgi:hypothetical protein
LYLQAPWPFQGTTCTNGKRCIYKIGGRAALAKRLQIEHTIATITDDTCALFPALSKFRAKISIAAAWQHSRTLSFARQNSKKITKCIKCIPGIYHHQRHGAVITRDGSRRSELVARRRIQQVFHYCLCLLHPHILQFNGNRSNVDRRCLRMVNSADGISGHERKRTRRQNWGELGMEETDDIFQPTN